MTLRVPLRITRNVTRQKMRVRNSGTSGEAAMDPDAGQIPRFCFLERSFRRAVAFAEIGLD